MLLGRNGAEPRVRRLVKPVAEAPSGGGGVIDYDSALREIPVGTRAGLGRRIEMRAATEAESRQLRSKFDGLVYTVPAELKAAAEEALVARRSGRDSMADLLQVANTDLGENGQASNGVEQGGRGREAPERRYPNEVLVLPTDGQVQVALLETGDLLVNQDDKTSARVGQVREWALRKGVQVERMLFVSGAVLAEVYQRFEHRVSSEQVTQEDALSAAQAFFVQLVDRCAKLRGSDIHVTLARGIGLVEFRVDGGIEQVSWISGTQCEYLLNVIYISADDAQSPNYNRKESVNATISATGSGQGLLPAGLDSIRLQFRPQVNDGATCAMRLLYRDAAGDVEDIDGLGYASFQVSAMQDLRLMAHGMNIFVGETGSGKTTSLQVMLMCLYREREGSINLCTVEDPVEAIIPGAKQMSVVVKRGEDRRQAFNMAVSDMMRADPDVVMKGEIRDLATAEAALRATTSGHSVWSTLHATTSMRALQRLLQLGIEKDDILDAGTVTGLVAQRLVPLLCEHCSVGWEEGIEKERVKNVPRFVARLEEVFEGHEGILRKRVRFRNVPGCREPSCRAGYRGRTVVAEVLVPDLEFMETYKESRVEAEKYWIGKLGGVRMVEHGSMKMLGGLVDPLDLNRKVGLVKELQPGRVSDVLRHARDEGFLGDGEMWE